MGPRRPIIEVVETCPEFLLLLQHIAKPEGKYGFDSSPKRLLPIELGQQPIFGQRKVDRHKTIAQPCKFLALMLERASQIDGHNFRPRLSLKRIR